MDLDNGNLAWVLKATPYNINACGNECLWPVTMQADADLWDTIRLVTPQIETNRTNVNSNGMAGYLF